MNWFTSVFMCRDGEPCSVSGPNDRAAFSRWPLYFSSTLVGLALAGFVCQSSGQTVVTFTSSGTWTVPAGVTSVNVLVVAAGGGGTSGGGGGGGVIHTYDVGGSSYALTPGAVITVTVGAGGAPGANASSQGTQGGNSVFGTFVLTTRS